MYFVYQHVGLAQRNSQKIRRRRLEVGAETTPKSVEATSSPMVQKIKNTSGEKGKSKRFETNKIIR